MPAPCWKLMTVPRVNIIRMEYGCFLLYSAYKMNLMIFPCHWHLPYGLHKISLLACSCSQISILKLSEMIHLTLERNFYYLVLLSLIPGTNVKDIAFNNHQK